MQLKKILAVICCALGVAICINTGRSITPSDEKLTDQMERLKERFRNAKDDSFSVPLTFLMGNPFLWDGEIIETEGYVLRSPGIMQLTLEPEKEHRLPYRCTIDISPKKNWEPSDFVPKERLIKVKGKFIVLGAVGTTGSLGLFADADVVISREGG